MNDSHPAVPEQQLRFLEAMIAGNATISGDVAEIGARTFAIHGTIAVDGDVIMASFNSYDAARTVLDQLPPGPPRAHASTSSPAAAGPINRAIA